MMAFDPKRIALAVTFMIAAGLQTAVAERKFDPAIYTATPNPYDIPLAGDTNNTAYADIGPEGGRVSVKGSDGTVYELVIPPKALGFKESITMAPVKTTADTPKGFGRMLGVVLAPEGLEFQKPVFLTIKPARPFGGEKSLTLGFAHGGKDARLAFMKRNGSEITIPLIHFSGAAVTETAIQELVQKIKSAVPGKTIERVEHELQLVADDARQAGKDPDEAMKNWFQKNFLATFAQLFSEKLIKDAEGNWEKTCDAAGKGLQGYILSQIALVAESMGVLKDAKLTMSSADLEDATRDMVQADIPNLAPKLKSLIRTCLDIMGEVCLKTGNFKPLQDYYRALSSMGNLLDTFTEKNILQVIAAADAPARVKAKAEQLAHVAGAYEDLRKAANYRDQILGYLLRCARYKVDWQSKLDVHEAKGGFPRWQIDSTYAAVANFQPGGGEDPILSGAVRGKGTYRVDRCAIRYERPTAAYTTTQMLSCGPAKELARAGEFEIEIEDIVFKSSSGWGEWGRPESIKLKAETPSFELKSRDCGIDPPFCNEGPWIFNIFLPYSRQNEGENRAGKILVSPPPQRHPILFKGTARGRFVDDEVTGGPPYALFTDVSEITVEHIGTGATPVIDRLRGEEVIKLLCQDFTFLCSK